VCVSFHGVGHTKFMNKKTETQVLCFWILPILFLFKSNISETAVCPHLQVKPTQLGPVDRGSPLSLSDSFTVILVALTTGLNTKVSMNVLDLTVVLEYK
jgi:hypothetical protein